MPCRRTPPWLAAARAAGSGGLTISGLISRKVPSLRRRSASFCTSILSSATNGLAWQLRFPLLSVLTQKLFCQFHLCYTLSFSKHFFLVFFFDYSAILCIPLFLMLLDVILLFLPFCSNEILLRFLSRIVFRLVMCVLIVGLYPSLINVYTSFSLSRMLPQSLSTLIFRF